MSSKDCKNKKGDCAVCAQISDGTVADRLRALYHGADADALVAGRVWYRDANDLARAFADEFGQSADTVAGVIAALSPRCRWTRNVLAAQQMLAGKPVTGMLSASVRAAARILAGARPLDVLGGPKTRAFYINVGAPDVAGPVTVDVHAFAAAAGGAASASWLRHYAAVANEYTRVAVECGEVPHEFQAIIWVIWRGGAA